MSATNESKALCVHPSPPPSSSSSSPSPALARRHTYALSATSKSSGLKILFPVSVKAQDEDHLVLQYRSSNVSGSSSGSSATTGGSGTLSSASNIQGGHLHR
ncbi:hypothetical protein MMC25_006619 [Agyrium rufum]|nr:hypothetical protein [Agyrium rufum]